MISDKTLTLGSVIFAGLVMIVGGMWLLYKQKIYLDRETKEITEVETPLGKFRTNVPALVLFVLGFVPMLFGLNLAWQAQQYVTIKGEVQFEDSASPVKVYAVSRSVELKKPRTFTLAVPRVSDPANTYTVVYLVKDAVSDDQEVDCCASSEVKLAAKELRLTEFRRDLEPAAPGDFK